MEEDNNIVYLITKSQAKIICDYFDMDSRITEDYMVCEMLDKIIDNLGE